MGLFKKKKEKSQEFSFEWMTVGEAMSRSKMKQGKVSFEDVMERCEECCEQYVEAKARKREVQEEYNAISSYLTDIQKIEELPRERRQEINEVAQTMVRLNEERVQCHEDDAESITPAQFLQLERFEDEVEQTIQTLNEQEAYRDMVNSDIRNLEGEKGALTYEKEQINKRLKYFKNLSIFCVAAVLLVFMVLFYLTEKLKVDFTLVFLLTGLLALAMAAFVVINFRKARFGVSMCEAKTNRAILLLNKVKIKYVNSTNAIEYIYEKFGIASRYELEYLWARYGKIKATREKYQRNTELLEAANNKLVSLLQMNGVEDAEVWVYQPEALLDSKEMVEVRHHLNERRATVRERMNFTNKHFDIARAELERVKEAFPQYRDEIQAKIGRYEIKILA